MKYTPEELKDRKEKYPYLKCTTLITPEAYQVLGEYCDRTGYKKVRVLSRIILEALKGK